MSRFGRRLLATWSAKGGRSSARPTASRGWRPSAVDRSTSSRSEEHTSELQSRSDLVCRLLLEKKKKIDATLARSPGFFVGKPVVLDLSALDLSRAAITHLVNNLEERNIRVLVIEGVDHDKLTTSMPPLLTGGRSCVITRVETPAEPAEKPE